MQNDWMRWIFAELSLKFSRKYEIRFSKVKRDKQLSRYIYHASCQLDPSDPHFSSWNLIQRPEYERAFIIV